MFAEHPMIPPRVIDQLRIRRRMLEFADWASCWSRDLSSPLLTATASIVPSI